MFGLILLPQDILIAGNQYVFTFASGRWFEYRSDEWVLENLRERMSNYGHIVSVRRPLFSDRYIVVVQPTTSVSLEDWLSAFDVSWRDMGYNNYSFLQAEVGQISTSPGGVEQAVPAVTSAIGESISKAVTPVIKPLAPFIIVFGLAYLFIYHGIPQLAKSKRRSIKR